jgi:hypothetical protein
MSATSGNDFAILHNELWVKYKLGAQCACVNPNDNTVAVRLSPLTFGHEAGKTPASS